MKKGPQITNKKEEPYATLIVLCRPKLVAYISLPTWRKIQLLSELCKEHLQRHHEKKLEDINWDVVDIWADYINLEIDNVKRKTERLQFGNLYSYVITKDVVVPYSEWVYDKQFVHNGRIYEWDEVSKVGRTYKLAETEEDHKKYLTQRILKRKIT